MNIDPLLYIHRQLAQRGEVVEYEAVENMKLAGDQKHYFINGVNKHLFILNLKDLPIGTRIISDTNITITEGSTVPADRIEEYNGWIHLELPGGVVAGQIYNVLFYRVV